MTSRYNDGTYLEQNPDWHCLDSAWKARQITRLIEKNYLRTKKVCEIGCGSGEILVNLESMLPGKNSFHGYDISKDAFDLCKKKQKCGRVKFYLNGVDNVKEYYDVVLAIDVIEHIVDLPDFLLSLKSLGVYKIFHIPIDLSVLSVARKDKLVAIRRKIGHIHYFTKNLALEILNENGYEIKDWVYTAGFLGVEPGSKMASLMRLPRLLLSKINKDLAARALGGYSLLVLTK